jgi:hypothetical protein
VATIVVNLVENQRDAGTLSGTLTDARHEQNGIACADDDGGWETDIRETNVSGIVVAT